MNRLWPLPAILTWALAWATFALLRDAGVSPGVAMGGAGVLGLALAWTGSTPWRRVFMAAGFPLSLLGAGSLPHAAWWLLPLLALLALYPMRSWRDAPLFPTPTDALRGLARAAPLPANARVLDAGCGAGDGLRALASEYPEARLLGLEWSLPLSLWCRWRCPFAEVRRADIWQADWGAFDLVYLFQRPESMPRAWDKARQQMRRGATVVSLAFEIPGVAALARLDNVAGKPVWVYRLP